MKYCRHLIHIFGLDFKQLYNDIICNLNQMQNDNTKQKIIFIEI